MPELSQLQRVKPVTTEIDMGDGDVVKVTFDRNKITSQWEGKTQQLIDEGSGTYAIAEALAEVMLTWDVTENGQQLEASVQNIAKLSIPAQGSLYRRVIVASVPADAEGNASRNTSSSAPMDSTSEQANPQNGPEHSPSPEPSASPSPT